MASSAERFDSKWEAVTECGCHIWTAAVNAKGYGKFGIGNGRWTLAHRHSYERANGPIADGMLICHRCDNPSCVNPNHLFLGSHKNNAQDRDRKNRRIALSGENHGRSKVTADEVRMLRELAHGGTYSYRALGRKFGLNSKTASDIVNRVIWTHV
jgi:hypothetical protein